MQPRLLVLLFAAVTLVSALHLTPAPARAAEPESELYVCPPCGHDCLKTTFPEPGACGECGMTLILLSEALQQTTMQHAADDPGRKRVAILLFDGVQIIDYTGPWEIFGQAGYEIFTVATSREPIETVFGMHVTPDFVLAEHPEPDIVVVPGGQVLATQNDPGVRKWLGSRAKKSEIILSVCNGAFILAKAGLLDGLRATTTRGLVDGLSNAGANITVVKDARYVDNGKIVTAGGLSAGMDAALHVVSRLRSEDTARRIARGLEYDWQEADAQE